MKTLSTTLFAGMLLCCTPGCKKYADSQTSVANNLMQTEVASKSSAARQANNYLKTTVQYKALAGIDPDLLSLDLYHYRLTNTRKPVVIYVHGGGWSIGDKTNSLDNKLSLFSSLNYIFVSINYRLSPFPFRPSNPNRVKYPDHNNDVADAAKWVFDHIAAYGGDPEKIALLGHSSGAHLVSLTGTSQQFLPARGLLLRKIKGVASIDTEGYDVPSQIGDEMYQNAFGTNNSTLIQASPIYNLFSSVSYPRFFVAKRGADDRVSLADAFINKLKSVGVVVSEVNGNPYTHGGINDAIGNPADTIITPALKIFFQQCFQ